MDRVAAMDKALGHQPRRSPDTVAEVAAQHHRAQIPPLFSAVWSRCGPNR